MADASLSIEGAPQVERTLTPSQTRVQVILLVWCAAAPYWAALLESLAGGAVLTLVMIPSIFAVTLNRTAMKKWRLSRTAEVMQFSWPASPDFGRFVVRDSASAGKVLNLARLAIFLSLPLVALALRYL